MEETGHRLKVEAVQPGDAEELAANLRESDRREVIATSLSDPLPAILRCVARSDRAWSGRHDGVLLFVGGVSERSYLSGKRAPWLLGTPALERHGREFLRYCVRQMPLIRERYPLLENYIDARNHRTMAWLQWLGFTVHGAEPYGALRRPFHRFTLGS